MGITYFYLKLLRKSRAVGFTEVSLSEQNLGTNGVILGELPERILKLGGKPMQGCENIEKPTNFNVLNVMKNVNDLNRMLNEL